MSQRYEIREQIGKGGLGAVYKAFDTQLHREVAMKRVLTTEQGNEAEVQAAADKLIAEAKTLSSLNHPNIVTVFDVGQDEKGGFVVMELLKGETLDETVSRGVLTQEDFIEVVYQTMEALISAQAANVLHRDLKPTNVMVIWQPSGKFQTKILDFGLAKFSKAPSVQTMDQEDAVMGSIYFMAPEQFERSELDVRTDLYQIGCVYYHALTGQYPFRGETGPQVMNAHLQHRVAPIEKLRPDLSPSICQWIMWLINREMENRPSSAREALERFPRNPEPPNAAPVLQAIPVEDTPQGATTGVQVVLPTHSAAPPTLLVAKTATGATTSRLRTGSAPVSAAGARKHATGSVGKGHTTGVISRGSARGATGPIAGADGATPSRKGLFISMGIALGVGLVAVGWMVAKDAKANAERERLAELASAEAPAGSPEDIDLAIRFLTAKEASVEQKNQAGDVLSKVTGNGIDDAIVAALDSSPSPYVRLKLAQAAGERDLKAAVPAMMKAFGSASSDSQKAELLNAVRRIATFDNISALLDQLDGDHSIQVRGLFEDIIIAIYRRQPADGKRTGELISRLTSTTDAERRSLFRILGALGSADVMSRLESIYQLDGEKALRYDGVNALMSWPNRDMLPVVEVILSTSSDNALKIACGRVYARLAGLPAAVPIEEKVDAWRKGAGFITRPQDARRLFAAMAENPAPEVKALLEELTANPAFSALAKQAIQQIDQAIAKAPLVGPGDSLPASQALISGDDAQGAFYNPGTESLAAWRSPDTWFVWHFKVKTAGNYGVEVLQSYPHEGTSEFGVIVGDQKLEGTSVKTANATDFKPAEASGTLALEPDKVYTLVLFGRGVTQPRMMDISAVKLTKK